MAAEFALLHSPLLGPSGWRAVAAELVKLGHRVQAPAWPRLSAIRDSFYATLADGMAASLRGSGLVLVAHSGAGALLPALAARMQAPPAGVIFADAILPHPGRSWFDTAPADLREQLRAGATDGQLPTWDAWWPPGALDRLVPDTQALEALTGELEPLALAYFEEAAPRVEFAVPGAYLQLSAAYAEEARLARGYGWPATRLPLHHLAMLTHPEAVAGAIAALGAELAGASDG